MLLRSPGPISPDTYSGHIRRRALCPNRLRNGMSQRSSSSCQSDILPTMVGPSKSRPPMSHRKTDLGIPCRSKSAKVVLGRVLINAQIRFSHPGFPPRPDVLASATWATDRHIYVGKAFEYHRVSRKTRRDPSFFHWARDHDLTHVAFSELLGTKL